MAWPPVAAVAVSAGGGIIAALCALQFTAMPILFFGHIAAMLLSWWLMSSGSVLYVMASLWSGWELRLSLIQAVLGLLERPGSPSATYSVSFS